jgi:hypothetical protein
MGAWLIGTSSGALVIFIWGPFLPDVERRRPKAVVDTCFVAAAAWEESPPDEQDIRGAW